LLRLIYTWEARTYDDNIIYTDIYIIQDGSFGTELRKRYQTGLNFKEEICSLSFIRGNTVLADGLNVEELYARAPRLDGPLACPNHIWMG